MDYRQGQGKNIGQPGHHQRKQPRQKTVKTRNRIKTRTRTRTGTIGTTTDTFFSFGLPTRIRKNIEQPRQKQSNQGIGQGLRQSGQPQTHFFLLDYQQGQGKGIKQPRQKQSKQGIEQRLGQSGQPQTHFFFWITNKDKEKHRTTGTRKITRIPPTRTTKTKTIKARNRTKTRIIKTTIDTFFSFGLPTRTRKNIGQP